MLIAIDGYNFIKQSPELRQLEQIELQRAREGLIDRLAVYRRYKGHAIVVIFDGQQEGRLTGHKERSKGIEVIFSKPGQKADDVLKRLSAEKRDGLIVVTSDRDVALYAEKKGAAVIPVTEFAKKIENVQWVDSKGSEEEDPIASRSTSPKKKGPAHRLSKSKRKGAAAARRL